MRRKRGSRLKTERERRKGARRRKQNGRKQKRKKIGGKRWEAKMEFR